MSALPDHASQILPIWLLGDGVQVASIAVFRGIERRRCSLQAFRDKAASQIPLSSPKEGAKQSVLHLTTSRLRAENLANVLRLASLGLSTSKPMLASPDY